MKLIIDGSDLMLFIDDMAVAYAKSHKLTINVETEDISSKDKGGKWKNTATKRFNWSVSCDALYIERGDDNLCQYGFGDLFDYITSDYPLNIWFGLPLPDQVGLDEVPVGGWEAYSDATDTGAYTGPAIITSLESNAPNGENTTWSIQLEGVGELVHEYQPEKTAAVRTAAAHQQVAAPAVEKEENK